jgi:hypothetical protein
LNRHGRSTAASGPIDPKPAEKTVLVCLSYIITKEEKEKSCKTT